MWGYVGSVLGLALLCALWVLFQQLLKRLDPDGRELEAGCGGCARTCARNEAEQCRKAP